MPTNYLSLSNETEASGGPSPTSSSSLRKYAPFCLHFALTALVAVGCLLVLDGEAFNTNSRRPRYLESDGSFSHLKSYAPLQSDVTTAVSLAASVTRVAGGWWVGGYIWRCIFVSMERDGISLEGLSRAVSNMPPAPRHFKRKSNMVIISTTLFFTYSIDYFSAVLTGAFVWESANRLIPGHIPVTGIPRGVSGNNVTDYFEYPYLQISIAEVGTAQANLAWLSLQPNSTNITEPATIFRRVLNQARYLPVNSTLNNVTIPYFVVDAFEWIKDPDPILTSAQTPLFSDYSQFSPFFSVSGIGGLLPDSQWGPPNANQSGNIATCVGAQSGTYNGPANAQMAQQYSNSLPPITGRQAGNQVAVTKLGNPQVVSETRLLALRIMRQGWNNGSCPQNYLVDPGSQINLHQYNNTNTYYDCFAIANVTYRAGAAVCQNCQVIAPTVVQAHAPLQLIPDSFTEMALELAPSLATYLTFSGYAVPENCGTRKNMIIELTSRAYQAAWASYSLGIANQFDDTEVQISLPTLRANVIPWRVYVWVALHLWVLVLGLLFVYIQSHCDHPWVTDPTMAVFWLDTSAVSSDPLGSDSQGIDPWRPKTDGNGMLILEKAEEK